MQIKQSSQENVRLLFFYPDVDMFYVLLAGFSLIYFKIKGSDHRCEFSETVVSRIEVGLFFQNQVSDISQISPSCFIRKVGN